MKDNVSGVTERGEIGYDELRSLDKDLIKSALRRGVTRREVMGWLIAAGTTVASAGSIVTAASEALAATPTRGGSVRWASDTHGPSDTLDPIHFTSAIDYTRGRCIYNNLVQHNEDLSMRPELAEEFSANDDGTEWTFKIRKGVAFHDGSPLTADDVIWSMNRHIGADSKSVAKTLVASVTEWKKVDSHTVKAILDSSYDDLPSILGTFHFKILKQDTTDFQKPVGTGPFRLQEFKPGVRSVHVRNDNYWREGANLDEIQIFAITDSVARVNAMLSGNIQLMQALDPKAISQVERTAGVEVMSVPSGAYFGICCMQTTSPGNNRDFVLAMKYLQRRKRIVKSILKGQGTLGNDQPINVAYGANFCSELPIRPFDPDKAKFHLDKSGITSAEIHLADVAPGLADTVLRLQREASKIGLNLSIKKVPNDGYWGAVWMKTPINVTTWNMRPTANAMLSIAFAPDAPWNDTLWKNERMGELLAETRKTLEPSVRHEIYCEMQTVVHNECGMIIPVHRNFVDAKSEKLVGIPTVPLGTCGASEWPEYAWLEA